MVMLCIYLGFLMLFGFFKGLSGLFRLWLPGTLASIPLS